MPFALGDITIEAQTQSHLATAVALLATALACGILSMIVLWRRWAFLGEGIAHAGFGGAGTAWLLAALCPRFDNATSVGIAVTVFCFLTAIGIGAVHRSGRVHSDTAIGAFLAGTLAWGFLCQQIYTSVTTRIPTGFQALLFGQTQLLDPLHGQLAVAMLLVCCSLLIAFRRQILLYCFDPDLAFTSGVRTTYIHYLLIGLITLAIVIGVRLVGSVLITAMLILPAATASLISRRLYVTLTLAAASSLGATLLGLIVARRWNFLPEGPVIVLALFAFFLITWLLRRRAAA